MRQAFYPDAKKASPAISHLTSPTHVLALYGSTPTNLSEEPYWVTVKRKATPPANCIWSFGAGLIRFA